ncbi:hypothetical protein [Sediminispirochaeta bajacaliforniensis]|uniref:hypothetical protein n=1 Tax=Sediminispirochaeta bajacaliforniensis TaxID=148 RepID=UPI0003627AB3|nr:hypothetical protein [Sediminispirochaeta bajacaliforniensis]
MKKAITITLLAALLTIVALSSVAAEESPYFVKTVSISKVYNHRLGYRVVYMTNDFQFKVLYIPQAWFAVAGQSGEIPKAELVLGNDPAYPYFSIFWKDGQFDHIRLYLKKDLNDTSWGDASTLGDIDSNFNVETLSLEF